MSTQAIEKEHGLAASISANYMEGKDHVDRFLNTVRCSRKHGFPIVNVVRSKSGTEQMEWAARLLLSVACPDTFDEELLDNDFKSALNVLLGTGSNLADDSKNLLSIATSCAQMYLD